MMKKSILLSFILIIISALQIKAQTNIDQALVVPSRAVYDGDTIIITTGRANSSAPIGGYFTSQLNNQGDLSIQQQYTTACLWIVRMLPGGNGEFALQNYSTNKYIVHGGKYDFSAATTTLNDSQILRLRVSPVPDQNTGFYGLVRENGDFLRYPGGHWNWSGGQNKMCEFMRVGTTRIKFGDESMTPTDCATNPDCLDYEIAATRIYIDEKGNISMPMRRLQNLTVVGAKLVAKLPTSETNDPAITTTTTLNISATDLANGIITFDGSNINFKEGYTYEIQAIYNLDVVDISNPTHVGSCTDCQQDYFVVKVIPEYAIWNPSNNSSTNTAWNNDANWSVGNADGQITNQNGFVPRENTNVVIANNPNGIYPILPEVIGSQENGYQTNIEKEYNFMNATCDQIFFDTKAMIGNQGSLTYNSASMDVALPGSQWTLFSVPTRGMYSGDFYVPSVIGSNKFVVDTYDGNYNIRFWQKMFNAVTPYNHNMNWDGATPVSILTEQGNWTTNFNSVCQPYFAGTGAAIWPVNVNNPTGEVVVRLPKTEENLYYYSYGVKTNIFEPTPRSVLECNKLAFDKDHSHSYTLTANDGDYFVFGNPTMAYIDIEQFLLDNSSVLENEYRYYHAISPETTDWAEYVVSNNVTSQVPTNYVDIVPGYLAPMRSIMVKGKVKDQITVTVTNEAITTQPTANQSLTSPSKTLFITAEDNNGHVSFASIHEDETASEKALVGEDAQMLLSSNSLSSSAVYTVSDEKALAINTLPQVNNIPVAVYADNCSNATISFDGVDNISGKLYIYDVQENKKEPITNNSTFTISTTKNGENIRYFIQKVEDVATDTYNINTSGIRILTQQDGSILVIASEPLTEVCVYGIDGSKQKSFTPNCQSQTIYMDQAIYIIHANTQRESVTQKIVR